MKHVAQLLWITNSYDPVENVKCIVLLKAATLHIMQTAQNICCLWLKRKEVFWFFGHIKNAKKVLAF